MKILVFDTETTGLPTKRNTSIYETKNWPYIIQLSFIMYDTETNEILVNKDYIINIGDDVELSPESVAIHGITREISNKKGISIEKALKSFSRHFKTVNLIVCHNVSFDKKMVAVESIRHQLVAFDSMLGRIPTYCTMKNTVDICKIPMTNKDGEIYLKYPKLTELHKHLFDQLPHNAHNAKVDIIICLRCFCKLKYNRDICRINRDFRMLFRECCVKTKHG